MYYPEEVIEEVRTRNDIVDIISGYVKLQKKGSNYFGLCPFHHEKSPSFSVSQSKQMYHCFGCGVSGNVFTFVMEYENYTFVEAVKMLADRAGITRSSVAVHISNLMKKGCIAGKGYIVTRSPYVTVVGGMNMDIGGWPSEELVAQDSNPGRVRMSPGGVGRGQAE